MKKNELVKMIEGKVSKVKFKFVKNRPAIFVVTGCIGVVASTVAACKATLSLNDRLAESRERLDELHYIKENKENPEIVDKDHPYSDEKVLNRDITFAYVGMARDVSLLYAPSVLGLAASIALIACGTKEYHDRELEMAALATNFKTLYDNYRKRTIDRFGEEVDKELRYGIVNKEFEETEVDKKGKEKTVKKEVPIAEGLEGISIYAKFYDECCTGWTKDPEKNLLILRRLEDAATDKLKLQGHLFLNEVYDMLNIQRTTIGQKVGWIYDEKNPNGDNYVDFGIYNLNREPNRDFVNGYESVILLDFNVDGPIIDMI